jgi:hypothetical protein
MRAIYIADDGCQFDAYLDCVEHEKNIQLEQHIERLCRTVYDQLNYCFCRYNRSITGLNNIRDNIDEILENTER